MKHYPESTNNFFRLVTDELSGKYLRQCRDSNRSPIILREEDGRHFYELAACKGIERARHLKSDLKQMGIMNIWIEYVPQPKNHLEL